jgi:hypothetical protein
MQEHDSNELQASKSTIAEKIRFTDCSLNALLWNPVSREVSLFEICESAVRRTILSDLPTVNAILQEAF